MKDHANMCSVMAKLHGSSIRYGMRRCLSKKNRMWERTTFLTIEAVDVLEYFSHADA